MPADRRRRPRHGIVAAALAAVLPLTGCDVAPGWDASDGTEAPASVPDGLSTYVALGDSFTAAPLVPDTDLAGGCFRSSSNYPALLAEELDLELLDVSCSGAGTADVTGAQAVAGGRGTVPPQLRAVHRDTDLVTVGVGGNDRGVFTSLVAGCTRSSGRAVSCGDVLEERYGDPRAVLEGVGRRVVGVLDRISDKAPEATVVLVGYPRLASTERGCDLLPLTDGDRALVGELEVALNESLREAAGYAGVEFVDVHALSEGHEICSDEPWVNGIRTAQARALAFHPFAEGQRAVAGALAGHLREELG